MILCLIQARMASTRLPGKSMALLAGVPLIEHVVKRVHAATLANYVCVATTTDASDDVLAAHIGTLHNVGLYRGAVDDVLGRFYAAALLYPDADVVVRITADDPFKDPALIDYAITAFLHAWAEPADGIAPPEYLHLGGMTWPLGLDVEVFTRRALADAHEQATTPEDREHAGVLWMARELGAWVLKDTQRRGAITARWTIDEPDDLAWAQAVYNAIQQPFGYDDMIAAGVLTR